MTGFPDPSHNWQAALPNPAELRAAYARDGYAVVCGLFSAAEIAVLAAAFDRFWAEGMRLGRIFRHGNLLFRLGTDPLLGQILRMVQWPSWPDGLLDAVRLAVRLAALLAPLIGPALKQNTNQ